MELYEGYKQDRDIRAIYRKRSWEYVILLNGLLLMWVSGFDKADERPEFEGERGLCGKVDRYFAVNEKT